MSQSTVMRNLNNKMITAFLSRAGRVVLASEVLSAESGAH